MLLGTMKFLKAFCFLSAVFFGIGTVLNILECKYGLMPTFFSSLFFALISVTQLAFSYEMHKKIKETKKYSADFI
tara:strand:- start:961 stop:1185 length:225 start_codon:yes stop_codon:yes gene_type:complete